jgi:hypothetical protein
LGQGRRIAFDGGGVNKMAANDITYTPALHEGKPVILIRFDYDPRIVEEVKKLPGRKWDASLKCWYVPDTRENRIRFKLPVAVGLSSKRDLPKVGEVNKPALNALREKLILKSYSKNTQRTYYYEFAQFLYLLGNHSAEEMNEDRIRSYFLYCAEKLKLTESQINSRYNAVKFYYEQVLGRDRFFIDFAPPESPVAIAETYQRARRKEAV